MVYAHLLMLVFGYMYLLWAYLSLAVFHILSFSYTQPLYFNIVRLVLTYRKECYELTFFYKRGSELFMGQRV